MKSKRKRYWMFAFDKERPLGGMNDLRFTFNTVEEFEDNMLLITDRSFTTYQLLDTFKNFDFVGDLGTVTKWVCRNVGGERYEEDIY